NKKVKDIEEPEIAEDSIDMGAINDDTTERPISEEATQTISFIRNIHSALAYYVQKHLPAATTEEEKASINQWIDLAIEISHIGIDANTPHIDLAIDEVLRQNNSVLAQMKPAQLLEASQTLAKFSQKQTSEILADKNRTEAF